MRDAASTTTATASPPPWTATTPTRRSAPGAPEVFGNGVDEDCNGRDDVNRDVDRDGFAVPVDCDDAQRRDPPGRAGDPRQRRRRELRPARGAVARRSPPLVTNRWAVAAAYAAADARRPRRAQGRGRDAQLPGRLVPVQAHAAADGAARPRPGLLLAAVPAARGCAPGARVTLTISADRVDLAASSPTPCARGALPDAADRVPRARRDEGGRRAEPRRSRSRSPLLVLVPARAPPARSHRRRRRSSTPARPGEDKIAAFETADQRALHPLRRRSARRRPRHLHALRRRPERRLPEGRRHHRCCSTSTTATTSRRSARRVTLPVIFNGGGGNDGLFGGGGHRHLQRRRGQRQRRRPRRPRRDRQLRRRQRHGDLRRRRHAQLAASRSRATPTSTASAARPTATTPTRRSARARPTSPTTASTRTATAPTPPTSTATATASPARRTATTPTRRSGPARARSIGNAVDENCDTRIEPFPPVLGSLTIGWSEVGVGTRNERLVARSFLARRRGSRSRCSGGGCPFKTFRRTVRRSQREPARRRSATRCCGAARASRCGSRARTGSGGCCASASRTPGQPTVGFLCLPPGGGTRDC